MMSPTSILLALLALLAPAPLPDAPAAPPKRLAVLYFDNHTGDPNYDALGRGIAAMMITDISGVDGVQVVERERLQDLVKEIDAQRSRYFDSSTAVKVGRMAGAEFVVTLRPTRVEA